MISRRRSPHVAASAAVVLLAVLGTGCGSSFTITSSGSSSSVDGVQTETTDTTFREPITRLELASDAGEVELSAGPDGQVDVQQRLEWTDGKPEVSAVVDGETLRVEAHCPPSSGVNRHCEVGFVIRLPAATVVDAQTDAGAIKAGQLAGDQRLSTSAGGITGSGLKADVVEARNRSGGVELEFVEPPQTVTAESNAGRVEVTLPRDGERYQVHAETRAGQTFVEVATDPAGSRTISATSNAGRVSVGYP